MARDGEPLEYRHYRSDSGYVLILIHGSGWHSQYFYPLAKKLASQGVASVYTPNLRGHGITPKRRGDVEYIGQLDDDLEDFIRKVKAENPNQKIILGGHSSGGGLCVRFAGAKAAKLVDGYILLAPYLTHDAPIVRRENDWAKPKLIRVITAHILNGFGLHWMDHIVTLEFNLPAEYRNGTETTHYTHAMLVSLTSDKYQKILPRMKKTLVLVGSGDEVLIASAFMDILKDSPAELMILPDIDHIGVVTGKTSADEVGKWIESFS
jgi:pimeloyl-ACP methyl ester carboxylesterase